MQAWLFLAAWLAMWLPACPAASALTCPNCAVLNSNRTTTRCSRACKKPGRCVAARCGVHCCRWQQRREHREVRRFVGSLPAADVTRPSSVKLVVNTYAGSRPLQVLMYSLLAAGFERFDDTIFVRGGGGRDSPPRYSTLDAIAGVSMEQRRAVLVEVPQSNFDWHGLAALHKYRDHPLVRASGYLYTLDSTTVAYKFPGILNRFDFSNPMIVYTVPLPNSNIAAFGAGVVRAFGHSYEVNVSKAEGLIVEFNQGSVAGMRSLVSWGEAAYRPGIGSR